MKQIKLFLALGIFMIFCSTVWADIPNLINFQGILDSAGNPLANKTKSVEFKIYDASAGGNVWWSETQSVTTNAGGIFNVVLGTSNPIPDTAFEDTLRYLGIKVGGDPEMTPRQQIVSNAYGYRVATVDGASGGTIFGNTSIQSDLAVSGNIVLPSTTPTAGVIKSDTNRLIHNFGTDNFFAGANAGNLTMTGSGNTGVGFSALLSTASGNYNAASGYDALYFNTSGFGNSAGGAYALYSNSTGNYNTASGSNALYSNTTGSYNTAIGYGADVSSGSLTNATAIGANAIVSASNSMVLGGTGANAVNVGIGTTGPLSKLHVIGDIQAETGDIYIGSNNRNLWGYSTGNVPMRLIGVDGSDNVQLGNISGILTNTQIYSGAAVAMTLLSSGNVGIGTTSPSERLHVVGNICATGTIAACSDLRYKTNLKTVSHALEKILNLKGIYFNWKKDQYPEMNFEDDRQIGFVAQELKEILPEVVSQGTDGFYSVDYGKLTPLLVEAIKEQQKTIQSLEEKLEKLEKKFSRFTGQTSGSEEIGYREEE